MFYTVYKVTNQINGKIYVGCHKTKDLDDGYMGSGKYLARAKEKHGIENFKKEILFVFDNPEQMFAKEAEIVNEDFLAEENTYNLKIGGDGGWDYLNDNSDTHKERARKANASIKNRFVPIGFRDPKHKEAYGHLGNEVAMQKYPNGLFFGRRHTEETKRKISEKLKIIQSGENNSQFGSFWITNEKENRKISSLSEIPEGWRRGRVLG